MGPRIARVVLWLALAGAVVVPGCRAEPEPTLVGRWQDRSQAALLYEFREDGSVWLVQDAITLPVFRYEVAAGNVLVLYDGMGRQRTFRYALTENELTLTLLDQEAVIYAEYERRR